MRAIIFLNPLTRSHICRFNFFVGCTKARSCTLLLRGGAEQFIDETERSLHDAIMIVRRAKKNDSVVAGVFFMIIELLYAPFCWAKFGGVLESGEGGGCERVGEV